jgi:Flp pilus assembly protein TadD
MPTGIDRQVAVGSFLVSALLWAFVFTNNPGITVLSLAFVSTALFAQALVSANLASYTNFSFNGWPKTLGLVFVILLLLAGVGFTEILSWNKIKSADTFSKALVQYQRDGNLANAEAAIVKANSLAQSDLYHRTLSNIYLMDLSNKLQNAKSSITESEKTALQNEVNAAVTYTKLATAYNPSNYLNYLAQAKVFEELAYQNIQGAVDNAQTAYTEAEMRNPSNPSIQLAFARLAALKGEVDKSREYANKSTALKENFAPAYYFLAQLEAAVNNVPKAISNVEKAAASDPTNAGLHFQLGLIKYNVKDFKGAAVAFENSLQLIPEYANAKYFLGLSYYYSGDKESAIKKFEEVQKTNPDNAEVKLILSNLEAGRDPFASAKPPIDNKPGQRKTPPIE